MERTLRKAIGRTSLTNEQLLTVLKESEAVVNSRPLVYAGNDIQSHITLTPAHFLSLNSNIGIPNIDTDDDNDFNPNAANELLQTWKKRTQAVREILANMEKLLSIKFKGEITEQTERNTREVSIFS